MRFEGDDDDDDDDDTCGKDDNWWGKGGGRTVLDLRAMVAVIRHMKVCRHLHLPSTIYHGLFVELASTWVFRHIYT